MAKQYQSTCKITTLLRNGNQYLIFKTPDGQKWTAKIKVEKDGKIIDNEEVLLGQGAFGKVYTVTNDQGEERALKVMSNRKERKIENIKRDARTELNKLNALYKQTNSNLVGTFKGMQGKIQVAALMPKIHGKEATDILRTDNPFSNHNTTIPVSHRFNSLNSYFTQLSDLHKEGYIHADIKLQNTLITDHRQLNNDVVNGTGYDGNHILPFMSIIDLGLSAKVNRAGERLFFKGGSPAFMANETLENKKTSFAADIYSSMEIALNVLGCDSVSSWGDKDKEHSKLFKYAMDNVDNITKKEYKVAKTRLEELNDFLDIHDKIKFDRSLDQIYLSQDSHKHPPNFGFNGLTGPDYSITKQIENLFKTAQQMKDSMPNVEVPDVRFTPNQLKDVMTMMLNENPLARPSASELSEFFANYETMVLQLEVLERLKANEGLGLDSIDQVLSAQGVSPDILAQRFISMPLSSKVIQVKKWRVESSGEPNNKNKIREFSEKGEFTSEQQENLVNYLYNNETGLKLPKIMAL